MATKGTLKYRKVERTPQVGKDAGKKKYYATAVQDRTMEFEDFVSHISDHGSPYSRGCIHGVLMDALDHLQELILDGKSVRLGELGLFSIGMTSRGEDSPAKVTAQSIEGVHLILRNTKNWSNAELKKRCRIELLGGSVTTDDSNGDGGDSNGGGSGPSGDNNPQQGGASGDNSGSQDKGDGGSGSSTGSGSQGGTSGGSGASGDNTEGPSEL